MAIEDLSKMDGETLIFWALKWMIEERIEIPLSDDKWFEQIHRTLRDIQVELATRVTEREPTE